MEEHARGRGDEGMKIGSSMFSDYNDIIFYDKNCVEQTLSWYKKVHKDSAANGWWSKADTENRSRKTLKIIALGLLNMFITDVVW